MGYSFRLAARILLYAQHHRQDITYHGLCYTSRAALAETRNGSTMKDRSDDQLHHERTILPRQLRDRVSWCGGSSDRSHTVLENRSNNGRGMCYPVFGMVHIKYPLLLNIMFRLWSGGSGCQKYGKGRLS